MTNKIKNFLLKNAHFFIIAATVYFRYGDYNKYLESTGQKESQVTTIKNRLNRLKKQEQDFAESLKELRESKRGLSDTKEEILSIQARIPKEIRDTDILELLSKEAELLSIKDVFLRPQAESKKEFYTTKKYELKARGTFLQFLVYFERLAKKQEIIDIINLEMNVSDNEKNRGRFQSLDLTAQLEVFSYNLSVEEVDTVNL